MKRQRLRTLNRAECIGTAIVLVGGTVIYTLLIHPSIQSYEALEEARGSRDVAVQELLEVQRQQQALLNQITNQKRQLESLGGSPPSLRDKENQIARIMALARECHLAIDQYSPVGDVDTPEYSAVYVALMGRGSFPSIREFLRRIEKDVDYVDVTHFTLTASQETPGGTSGCLLTLSCKLSGMPRLPQRNQPLESSATPDAMEVVFHEP